MSANGATRTEVKVGEAVALAVHAEVPLGAGTVIAVKWDFDGSGTYPYAHDVDGKIADMLEAFLKKNGLDVRGSGVPARITR